MEISEAKVAVARGVKFMNKEFGRYWLRTIRLDELDMNSCSNCVLGQVDTDFSYTVEGLGMSDEDITKYGFDLPPLTGDYSESNEGMNINYARLTKAWIAAIKAERKRQGL